jgi:hypothetical protein
MSSQRRNLKYRRLKVSLLLSIGTSFEFRLRKRTPRERQSLQTLLRLKPESLRKERRRQRERTKLNSNPT